MTLTPEERRRRRNKLMRELRAKRKKDRETLGLVTFTKDVTPSQKAEMERLYKRMQRRLEGK